MTTLSLTDPVNGTVADANTIASNNAATKTVINGNIDNTNIAAAAALAVTKLATGGSGQVLGTLGGANTWIGGLGQIADSTAGGNVASFDFTSLPATYAHLLIVAYLRGDTAASVISSLLRFNNDSGANYDFQRFTSQSTTNTGAGQFASTSTGFGRAPANTAPANEFSTTAAFVGQYKGSSNHKSIISLGVSREASGTGGDTWIELDGGSWFAASAAINRITVLPSAGNFVADSRVTVYGLG